VTVGAFGLNPPLRVVAADATLSFSEVLGDQTLTAIIFSAKGLGFRDARAAGIHCCPAIIDP
jgi:hypothetical protein